VSLKLLAVNRITDRLNCLSVNIGEYCVSYGNVKIATWGLGSCVAIILYDSIRLIGGLAHALLPQPSYPLRRMSEGKKYASVLVDLMVKKFMALGSELKDLEAALIGGAHILSILDSNIGERNVIAAKKRLKEWGIKVVAQDIGGRSGRNVLFYVNNGHILVSYTLRRGFRCRT